MRRFTWPVFAVAVTLAVALSIGVASASASGGNSASAKLCKQGKWMFVQGSDGTQFGNEEECVSFGAHGGTIVPKPPCTAGSENFSEDAVGSQPTTFAGGTIDGPYADLGRVFLTTSNFDLPAGTKLLFSGVTTGPFRLTFTAAVRSVQLDAVSNAILDSSEAFTVTLTAYDSSGAVVGTPDTYTNDGILPMPVGTLFVSSTTNNIKYFTMVTTSVHGLFFTNIEWGCS